MKTERVVLQVKAKVEYSGKRPTNAEIAKHAADWLNQASADASGGDEFNLTNFTVDPDLHRDRR